MTTYTILPMYYIKSYFFTHAKKFMAFFRNTFNNITHVSFPAI